MRNQFSHGVHLLIAVRRAPIIAAVYFEAAKYFDEMRAEDDAVLSKVGALVAAW